MYEEVANYFWAFGHKESFATTELLLFQLADVLDLILADCHRFKLFPCKVTKILR